MAKNAKTPYDDLRYCFSKMDISMKKSSFRALILPSLLVAVLFQSGCVIWDNEFREVTAERLARPAFMVERRIETAGPMDFQLWERMHERYAPANVYIEGDGMPTYLSRIISENPTPESPMGLALASRDNADNLLYIGRPCQFREFQNQESCSKAYWSNRRFSPEVLAGYNEILDEVKKRWDITEFNIIGYDGGANIAAALAATRSDIVSLRTVAGNLNPAMAYAKTEQKLDADSILANVIAPDLADMPQHHFIAAGDEHIPPAIYHSFVQAMGPSSCIHYTLVPDADHEKGFVERWPEFLKSTTACEGAVPSDYVPVDLPPVPDVLDKR
jgi:hypothetical protein